ncbi:MAG: hypothetical protein J7L32_05335 [Thermoplasmata archaeon]|nr:hypothetical protein [Thermoplasmata archaeon]
MSDAYAKLQQVINFPPSPARSAEALMLAAEIADEIATLEVLVEQYELRREEIEAKEASAIAEATNEDGKKLYTNDSARKNALVIALRNNQSWAALTNDLRNTKSTLGSLKRYSRILGHMAEMITEGRI